MAVNLLEGHLARQVNTKENHAGDPEEEDVPACFKDGGWVEFIQISGLGDYQYPLFKSNVKKAPFQASPLWRMATAPS